MSMTGDRKVYLAAFITEEIRDRLRVACRASQKSVSQFINDFLDEHLPKKEQVHENAGS